MPNDKVLVKKAKARLEMWRHEDTLMNQRVTWLAIFNTFLVNALAMSWTKGSPHGLRIGVSVCGLVVSVAALIGLAFSWKAMKDLDRWWKTNVKGAIRDLLPCETLKGFDADGSFYELIWYLSPWFVLPFVSIAGWIVALVFA
jgi:hypothetical protein